MLGLYLMQVPSFVWFDFWVHVTEDKEAETELDASSEFFFYLISELTW